MRIRDGCTVSLKKCCCEAHKGTATYNLEKVEKTISHHLQTTSAAFVFISGTPTLMRMLPNWKTSFSQKIKTWAHPELPGSVEESILHQIICVPAQAFIAIVPASTWAQTVSEWRKTTLAKLLENMRTRKKSIASTGKLAGNPVPTMPLNKADKNNSTKCDWGPKSTSSCTRLLRARLGIKPGSAPK